MEKKYRVIILTVLTAFVLLTGCAVKNTDLTARRGMLDLKTYNFKTQEVIELKGEWEFYWNELLTPQEINARQDDEKTYVKAPKMWIEQDYPGGPLPSTGYCTMKLTIKYPAHRQDLALKINKISSAYNLWIDGEKMFFQGTPSIDPDVFVPKLVSNAVVFETGQTGTIEIVLQIANFFHDHGGVWYEILLGEEHKLINQKRYAESFDLVFFGILLIIGIYNISLFIFNRKDYSFLYFALLCLTIGIKTLQDGESMFLVLFPDFNMEIYYKCIHIFIYAATVFFSMYLSELFPDENKPIILRAIQISSGIFSLFVLITPTIIFSRVHSFYNIILFGSLAYVFYILISSLINKKKGSIFVLIGFLIFGICIINDVLHSNYIIQTAHIVPFGLFVFIIFQSVLLSLRFSKIVKKSAHILEKTDLKRHNFFEQYGITNREKDIIELLIKGEKYQTISDTLFISVSTVKNHISRIYRKTEVNNRMELLNVIKESSVEKGI